MLDGSVLKASDDVSDVVKPYSEELQELEVFLRDLRGGLISSYDTMTVINRWRSQLPQLHAFVRGMLYHF